MTHVPRSLCVETGVAVRPEVRAGGICFCCCFCGSRRAREDNSETELLVKATQGGEQKQRELHVSLVLAGKFVVKADPSEKTRYFVLDFADFLI